jgi:hypothetical protein
MTNGADNQHQARGREAQCMELALAAQQRIDTQRPVQHEVVDQGCTDKRKKRFGHDRAGRTGLFNGSGLKGCIIRQGRMGQT